jgi:adenylate kinase
MLRQAMEQGSELGRQVKPIYDSGGLVPDHLMIELIRERLAHPDAESGFILDGFPRTSPQADALDGMLDEIGRELSVVFALQLPDSVAIERLRRRAALDNRVDDTPEAIARRLALYHERTEPLIEHYRAQGNLVGIHADRSVNEVFTEIQQALDQVAARS